MGRQGPATFTVQLSNKEDLSLQEDLEIIAARVPGRSIATVIRAFARMGVESVAPISEDERERYRNIMSSENPMLADLLSAGKKPTAGSKKHRRVREPAHARQKKGGGEDGIRTRRRRPPEFSRRRNEANDPPNLSVADVA